VSETFAWKSDYSVQISQFDKQHQTLFQTVNELQQAMSEGHGKDVVGKILQRLIDYTATHFSAEEIVMEKNGFPGLIAHRGEHRALVDQVLKFQKDFLSGKPGVAATLMPFLQKWLHDHIMQTDKKYAAFLNAKGIH